MLIKKEKKHVSIVKIVLIAATITAAVTSIAAAILVWKKNLCKDKELNDAIDAAIDAAFAEDREAEAFELDVIEIDA